MKVSGILMAILQSDKIIKNMDLPACRNCIHYKPSMSTIDFTSTFSKCENFGEKDIISDKITYKYADFCRNDEQMCGKEGRYFQESPYTTGKIIIHKLITSAPISIFISLLLVNFIIMIK
jgi:hypothetical protein